MPQNAREMLNEQFVADPYEVRRVLIRLGDALAKSGLDSDQCMRVEIATAECLNNIAEHAYVGQPPGQVTIEVRRGKGSLLAVLLRDYGKVLPKDFAAAPVDPFETPLDDLPEGGWGRRLVEMNTDRISYQRARGQNIQSLFFRV